MYACIGYPPAVVAVTALYLCQAHMSVLLLSNEAGSMQDSANHICWQQKSCFGTKRKDKETHRRSHN